MKPEETAVFDYHALATDGDGTLCRKRCQGKCLARRTIAAINKLRASGRKFILVTGETESQLAGFPHLDLFDLVVAENGAVLYRPATRKATRLADPPPAAFVRELRRLDVQDLSTGKVIVASSQPTDRMMGEIIRHLGMDWRLIYNRQQVMAPPAGIDKATGLAVALSELGLSPTEAVGIGDAENDLPLLRGCGCGAAVATAVPLLRIHADLVTRGGAGEGVVELIQRLLAGDLPAPRREKKAVG